MIGRSAMRFISIAPLALVLLAPVPVLSGQQKITIASKTFTESVVLGEILAGLVRHAGHETEHRRQLGGTRILWNALVRGEIDIYAEYTGTITREILSQLVSSAASRMMFRSFDRKFAD